MSSSIGDDLEYVPLGNQINTTLAVSSISRDLLLLLFIRDPINSTRSRVFDQDPFIRFMWKFFYIVFGV